MTKIIIVNRNDEIIDIVDKEVALKKKAIRRIVRIFIFNIKGELFIQKRSPQMIIYPNKWDQSVGGHVDEGESYEQAAYRELKEELGITGLPLRKACKFYNEETGEQKLRDFSTLFTATYDGEITINKREITEGRWVSLEELDETIKNNPNNFCYGFLHAYEKYKEISN